MIGIRGFKLNRSNYVTNEQHFSTHCICSSMTVTKPRTPQKRLASPRELDDGHDRTHIKRTRKSSSGSHSADKHSCILHSGIKPSGNLLFDSKVSIRRAGLGSLDALSDPLLLAVITSLSAKDILHLGSCSKALFAYCLHQPVWKDLFIRTANGKLQGWGGTWRKTYLQQFRPNGSLRSNGACYMQHTFATPIVDCTGIFSDELYQPYLCANVDIKQYFCPQSRHNRPGSTSRFNMIRVEAALTEGIFERSSKLASEPFIVSRALKYLGWPAFSSANDQGLTPRWAVGSLLKKYSHVTFRAEAFDCSLQTYCDYANNCSGEDAPLYLFDSRFVEKTEENGDPGMGADYAPPSFLKEDLFGLMGGKRPDYRWLVSFQLVLNSYRIYSTTRTDSRLLARRNRVVHFTRIQMLQAHGMLYVPVDFALSSLF